MSRRFLRVLQCVCDEVLRDDILNRNGFRQQLLRLDQLVPLLQDVAQVVHGVDVVGMEPESQRNPT